jgi:hypothetical protein
MNILLQGAIADFTGFDEQLLETFGRGGGDSLPLAP